LPSTSKCRTRELAFCKLTGEHRRVRRRKSDCPIHHALNTFGDAWSLLILRDLMFNDARTWSDFAHAEERIATNVLAERLERLRTDGLIRLEGKTYRLTHKGLALLPVMLELMSWSEKYDRNSSADRALVRRYRKEREKTLHTERARLLGIPAAGHLPALRPRH
jgi:DNA-binding HxlR family transcriptional regulator